MKKIIATTFITACVLLQASCSKSPDTSNTGGDSSSQSSSSPSSSTS